MVTFQAEGRVETPARVSVCAEVEVVAKSVSPRKVASFATVQVPVVISEVPAAMVSAPVPSGPEVTVPESGLLLPPMARPPAVTFTPPAKVLAPESWSTPAPDFTMPPFSMTETTFSEGWRGARLTPLATWAPTLKAAAAWPPRFRVPLAMVATRLGSMLVTVTPPETVAVPVRLSVELFVIVRPVKPLAWLARVTVEPPPRERDWAGMTPPRVWTKAAWTTSRPPVPSTAEAPRVKVPRLTTVPPV